VGLFGRNERCEQEGCGHPLADHVSDKVMHEGEWIAVHRCIACEREGGPCLDTAPLLQGEGRTG
jgi:hypothetical protein